MSRLEGQGNYDQQKVVVALNILINRRKRKNPVSLILLMSKIEFGLFCSCWKRHFNEASRMPLAGDI